MSFIFCILPEEVVKQATAGAFNEKAFALNPELILPAGKTEFKVKGMILKIVDNLSTVDYQDLYGVFHNYSKDSLHRQCLFVLKKRFFSIPMDNPFDHLLEINFIEEVIGCLVFSTPVIGEKTSYLVTNNSAIQGDCSLLSSAVSDWHRSNPWVKALFIYQKEFRLPACLRSCKDEVHRELQKQSRTRFNTETTLLIEPYQEKKCCPCTIS